MNTSKFPHVLVSWLPFAVAITVLSGLVYAAVQQSYRQTANDPQIEIAEDVGAQIAAGTDPKNLDSSAKVDIGTSLSPYVIIADADGKVVASTAKLGSESPVPPKGVLDAAKTSGQNRVTWQPKAGVRSAIVVVPIEGKNQFAIAGRSLREVESRVSELVQMVAIAWAVALLGTLAAMSLRMMMRRPGNVQPTVTPKTTIA